MTGIRLCGEREKPIPPENGVAVYTYSTWIRWSIPLIAAWLCISLLSSSAERWLGLPGALPERALVYALGTKWLTVGLIASLVCGYLAHLRWPLLFFFVVFPAVSLLLLQYPDPRLVALPWSRGLRLMLAVQDGALWSLIVVLAVAYLRRLQSRPGLGLFIMVLILRVLAEVLASPRAAPSPELVLATLGASAQVLWYSVLLTFGLSFLRRFELYPDRLIEKWPLGVRTLVAHLDVAVQVRENLAPWWKWRNGWELVVRGSPDDIIVPDSLPAYWELRRKLKGAAKWG